jgi:glycosyltransferase involved in cell wall biosynthesis
LGFPAAHKGWPIFKELFRRFGGDSRYKFYHFAARDTATLPGINFVTTEVTAKQRDAAGRLLAKHGIDIFLLLSNWPETFSFVAHEAISAGARVVCLADSGNVAELIKRLHCGEVFETVDGIINYFESMPVGEHLSAPDRPRYTIKNIGTSATIAGVAAKAEHASER